MTSTSDGTLRCDGGTTTYKYLSLVRCKGGNPAWDDEDGDKSLVAGKQPETWMPRVIVETQDGRDVIGVCYKREELVELPKRMTSEDAMEWAKEHQPGALGDFYPDEEVTA